MRRSVGTKVGRTSSAQLFGNAVGLIRVLTVLLLTHSSAAKREEAKVGIKTANKSLRQRRCRCRWRGRWRGRWEDGCSSGVAARLDTAELAQP